MNKSASDHDKSALERLPHGSGFRFIDRLDDLHPGRQGTGRYQLRGDEPFLEGHFPGNPMMPGVLLIEMAAQLAGVVAQCDPEHAPMQDLRLTAVQQAKSLGTAKPGQTLVCHAEVSARMNNLVQASGRVEVEGREILKVQVTLSGRVIA